METNALADRLKCWAKYYYTKSIKTEADEESGVFAYMELSAELYAAELDLKCGALSVEKAQEMYPMESGSEPEHKP